MTTTELKRYDIRPEAWDDFLSVWRGIVTLRKRHGYNVLFAFADREQNLFTWAIEHHGDVDQAAKDYYQDPDRIALEIVNEYVSGFSIRRVEPLEIP